MAAVKSVKSVIFHLHIFCRRCLACVTLRTGLRVRGKKTSAKNLEMADHRLHRLHRQGDRAVSPSAFPPRLPMMRQEIPADRKKYPAEG